MRWLTIPLRRDADVLFARGRLRAFVEATRLSGMDRTRLVTVGTELARAAVATRDGSIEFGWERDLERPFCTVDLPSYADVPADLVHEERERSEEDRGPLRFEIQRDRERTRYRFLVESKVPADEVQRAVAEAPEATAVEMLREQNLEMARMLGTLRDREFELMRALDEARRNANEATAHALHLQEIGKKKDELLAIASHDIRSPVAAAKGALELLEPTLTNLSDDQKHLLGVARRAADTVVHLLGNLLSTALLEGDDDSDVPPPIVDFGLVAREVIDQMGVQARHKGLQLHFDVEPGPATVRGDLMWIRQVVSNLVNNALKFTPKGGHVDVRVRREGGDACLVVEDDGVGIPADKIDRVFDRLSKLRPRGTAGERGTGIGLFVTRQLVARLGGTIRVARREPAGTRFEVRVPFAAGVAVPIADQQPV